MMMMMICENNMQIINVSSIGSVIDKFECKKSEVFVEVVHFLKRKTRYVLC